MSYIIYYDPDIRKRYPSKKNKIAGKWLFFISLLIVFFALCLSQTVRTTLKNMLLPGDPVQTEKAWITFVEELKAGERITVAAADFCMEIVNDIS